LLQRALATADEMDKKDTEKEHSAKARKNAEQGGITLT